MPTDINSNRPRSIIKQIANAVNLRINRLSSLKRNFEIVFKWNHFEMRLLNLRINFYLFIADFFVLILVVFVLFLLSLRFGQI